MRGRAEVARQAHNLEVGGSSPPPATLKKAYSNYYLNAITKSSRKCSLQASAQVMPNKFWL